MEKKFDLSKFEVLETKGETLKGGFSFALSTSAAGGKIQDPVSNNCNGGNCAAGCGSGSNRFICMS
jgi:hypothetical protein